MGWFPFSTSSVSHSGRSAQDCCVGREGTFEIRINILEITMRTQGEIEADVCKGIVRFEREYLGQGPKVIQTHLFEDLLVIRLQGVLTVAEQHLAKVSSPEKGRDLLKGVRTQLFESARSTLEAMVHEATDVNVVSMHHDISTTTGEEVVVLTLSESPLLREKGRPSEYRQLGTKSLAASPLARPGSKAASKFRTISSLRGQE